MSKQLQDLVPGDWVCVYGRGTDMMIHRHRTVKRITKTLIVLGYIVNGREVESRYNRRDGYSVPRSEYGGSVIHTKCQGKKVS
jgi:hypothetical protein